MIRAAVFLLPLAILVLPALGEEKKKPTDEELVRELASQTAVLIQAADFQSFSEKILIDKKAYRKYYKKKNVEVTDRGWTEFLEGMKKNFADKKALMTEPALTVNRATPGKDAGYSTFEVWCTFKTADPAKPGDLILLFIKTGGDWRVISLE
jgi:hypothetical protein